MVFSFFYTNNQKLMSLYGVPTLSYVPFMGLYKLITDSYWVIQFLHLASYSIDHMIYPISEVILLRFFI